DRAPHRLTRGAIPHYHGLALIGDADDVGRDVRVLHGAPRGVERAVQEIAWIVLHPAGLGKVLRNFAVAAPNDATALVDHETGRSGGALIDRQDVLHGAQNR